MNASKARLHTCCSHCGVSSDCIWWEGRWLCPSHWRAALDAWEARHQAAVAQEVEESLAALKREIRAENRQRTHTNFRIVA